jgi:hypothetical protein
MDAFELNIEKSAEKLILKYLLPQNLATNKSITIDLVQTGQI